MLNGLSAKISDKSTRREKKVRPFKRGGGGSVRDLGGEEGAQGPLYIVEGGNKEKHKCQHEPKKKEIANYFFHNLISLFEVLDENS